MAELQFPDIGGNALGAFLQGQQRGKQSKLASLLGTAVSDPAQRQGAINQAAMIDPQAAMSARKSLNDESLADLARDANMFVALAQSGDQATLGQAYQQIAQKAQAVFGHPFPTAYDPKYLPMIEKLAGAGGGTGGNVQSTYIDDKGQRVAIMRDGSVQVLGANAPNNQIIDTGNGFFGVNKGNLQAAPVMTGGAPQQQAPRAPGEVPFSIDPSLPPEVQADIRANEVKYAQAPDQSQVDIPGAVAVGIGGGGGSFTPPAQGGLPPALDYQNGGQLRSVPKPASPAEQQRLDMDRQRLVIAQQAAERAGQAAQSAADAKNLVAQGKAQKSAAAAQDTIDNLSDGVSQIDALLKSPGMKYLGSAEGDALLHIPVIRNSAKDANAQLDVIRNRVVLNTLASLKSLSTNGASGFGALSNQEGEILRNSIASLSNAQTNAQIISGLKQVQQVMQRSAQRIRALQAGQTAQAPQGGGNVIRYDAQGNRIQ